MFSYINPSSKKTKTKTKKTQYLLLVIHALKRSQFSSVAQSCLTPCDPMKRSRITLKGEKIE